MVVKFNFLFKKRIINIDVKVCNSILSQTTGLMFRKGLTPMLFIFNHSTNQPIHSFFCIPFIAIWFNKKRIVDVKYIKPYQLFIKPKENFDKLLEIPLVNPVSGFILDKLRKV